MSQVAGESFRFSTKAGNLAQLDGQLTCADTLPQEVFSVADWRADRRAWLTKLGERFCGLQLIVRSSAPSEDSLDSSMAGAFKSVPGVPSGDPAILGHAVDEVIDSYSADNSESVDSYELIVQPMVRDVAISGVIFTRDLEKSGPYFVLNYDDETARTDTVTSGTSHAHKVVWVLKQVNTASLDRTTRTIVDAARELEAITACNALDIEFVIDRGGGLYVLQVRPLARIQIFSYPTLDARVEAEIRDAGEFVRGRMLRKPHLLGESTVFGEMPDWNPAEMIGTRPKPLAVSLYRYLILKSTWREARRLLGYRSPFPCHLMVEIAGRPYIDVRCSFNSFIPATLRDDLGEKLVNFYLAELRRQPQFHDKVEFEILISCLTFDFDVKATRLSESNFSSVEIDEVRRALLDLTNSLVMDQDGVLDRLERDVETLALRREKSLATLGRDGSLMMVVEELTEDCIEYGTLPFSVFARCAFVATSLLRSLVSLGALSQGQYEHYLLSIDTVAGEFVRDMASLKAGSLDVTTFLHRYGHLRPGTYDVCTPTYAELPDVYLSVTPSYADDHSAAPTVPSEVRSGACQTNFPREARSTIQGMLASHGFGFGVDELNTFIVRSVQLREAVKFEFTKNLSAVLSLLVEFGRYHGLTRDSLAFVPIERWLELANRNVSDDWISGTRELIDRNRERYALTGTVALPDLIFSERDTEVISLQERQPNFVTQKRVVAPSCCLTGGGLAHGDHLKGRIVLVENADPGYDWLFSQEIGGLVTKYGGAASHMTIRCAEFGLPAAIGCGEQIFLQLQNAKSILLDCAEHRVRPNEV